MTATVAAPSFARNAGDRPPAPEAAPPHHRLARGLRMLRHVPASQVLARVRLAGARRAYGLVPQWALANDVPAGSLRLPLPDHLAALTRASLDRATLGARVADLVAGRLEFAGTQRDFRDGIAWDGPHPSPLWGFHLHYLAPVLELAAGGRGDVAAAILGSWRARFDRRWDPVAWHSYPTSLRLVNVVLAASLEPTSAIAGDLAPWVARHAAYLQRHLEYDLRGNHLLENARALMIAGAVLDGPDAAAWNRRARDIVATEIPEQILPDGAHFELSPMYHCVVLHRLLEMAALLGDDDPLTRETLAPAIARAAGFLEGILCPDGDIPLLGDAARNSAPPPAVLLDFARRYGATRPAHPEPGVRSFPDSGIHVWRSRDLWAVLDAGPVCPPYLPGHGQADSLTVEVWVRGACVVTDPGTHEYTGPERAWNRSSRAHSTVTVNDEDTSEVWGSFRVGGRARVFDVQADDLAVAASMQPWNGHARCRRTVRFADAAGRALHIADEAAVPAGRTARSRLHLHPDARLADGLRDDGRVALLHTPAGPVRITARHPMRLEPGRCSRQFGLVEPTTILVQDLRDDAPGLVRASFRIEPVG